MKIEELKTKVKVIFPEECEIFLVEESKEELLKTLNFDKLIEIDFTNVESIDTTFIQLITSYLKTLKNENIKYQIKAISERTKQVFGIYGLESIINEGGLDA